MASKLKSQNNTLMLIVAFIAGILVIALSSNILASDAQGNFKNPVIAENPRPFPAAVCNVDNCDLLDAINYLHDEVGYSTDTLQSVAATSGYQGDLTRGMIWNQVIGNSTWNLAGLALKASTEGASTRGTIVNRLGNSSWNLGSLAQHISTQCQ